MPFNLKGLVYDISFFINSKNFNLVDKLVFLTIISSKSATFFLCSKSFYFEINKKRLKICLCSIVKFRNHKYTVKTEVHNKHFSVKEPI